MEPYSGGDQGGVAIEQVIRTVVAVAIDVPGPRRPALEIGEVGHKEAAGMSFPGSGRPPPGGHRS
ncbi:MAG: hypothetical protein H0W60_04545 [Chloroflexi bacterium]|nr:hypothetical protein [Chloroflexota bacterium]MBA3626986.1 hypothetical protein [Chloroflexota bacterium]